MALKRKIGVNGTVYIKSEKGTFNIGEKQEIIEFYARVESINGNKQEIKFDLSHRSGDNTFVEKYKFKPEVSDGSKNFIAQAYEHLKTLPEFAGATDC